MDELALLARLEGDDEDPTQAAKPTMMGKDMRQLIMSGQGPQALQLWKVGPHLTDSRFSGSSLSFVALNHHRGVQAQLKVPWLVAVLLCVCRHVQAVHVLVLAVGIGHA